MCLEQWSWVAAVVSAVVAVLIFLETIAAAILAWRYRHAPRITTGIVVSTDTGVYGTGTPLGLRIRDDLHADIRAPIMNFTRNITRFRFTVRSWFVRGGPYYDPVEREYRGETIRESRPGALIEGHFFINLSSVLSGLIDGDGLTPQTDVTRIVEYFTQNIFRVSTTVNYVGFLPWLFRRAHEPTFEYYFVPTGQPAIPWQRDEHGHYSIFIPGQWVPGHPH